MSAKPKRGPQPDMREEILRQATRLFAARGYEATSLQELADAVGLRKPSLLHYFPSKTALHQKVLEKMLKHWNDVLPRVLLAATSASNQFDGVLQAMVDFFAEDPDRARLVLREVLDRPDRMRESIHRDVSPWVDAVANYIREGQKRGNLRPDVDPEAYVVQVINLLVASIATRDTLGSLAPNRNLTELLRVAKSSLFRPEE